MGSAETRRGSLLAVSGRREANDDIRGESGALRCFEFPSKKEGSFTGDAT